MSQATMSLEDPTAVKDALSRESMFRILGYCAIKYRQTEATTAALVDLLSKHDHLPTACAEMAEWVSEKLGDNQLVRCKHNSVHQHLARTVSDSFTYLSVCASYVAWNLSLPAPCMDAVPHVSC